MPAPSLAACRRLAAALCLAALGAAGVAAQDARVGDLTVIHPTARPGLPNRPVAVYLTVANDGAEPDRLIAARAPDFQAVEFHETRRDGDAISMHRLDAVDIPAGEAAVLEQGGAHLMLFGAARVFKAGESFPLVLIFERAGEVAVEVTVARPAHGQGAAHGHGG